MTDWLKPTTEAGAKVYLAALLVLCVSVAALMIFFGGDLQNLGRD